MSPKFRAYLDREQAIMQTPAPVLAGDGLVRMRCPECKYETRSATLRVKCPGKHRPHRMMLAIPPNRLGRLDGGTLDAVINSFTSDGEANT